MNDRAGTERREQVELAGSLRALGMTWVEIAEHLRARYSVNARVALRLAHGWSQSQVARAWAECWPSESPKTNKNVSYWELWPESGYMPSLDVLAKLAELYECSVSDLLADHGDYRHLDQPPERPLMGTRWPVPDDASSTAVRDQPLGWYIETFRVLLRLDRASPEAIEDRRIVSLVDELTEITAATTVPRKPDDEGLGHELHTELLHGGELTLREQPAENFFRYVVVLNEPISRGERHEYTLLHRVPNGQAMVPHYVFVPLIRCDLFELRVKFGSPKPSNTWRLAGSMPRMADNRRPVGEKIEADRFGEIRLHFRNLQPGRGYGVKWEPSVNERDNTASLSDSSPAI